MEHTYFYTIHELADLYSLSIKSFNTFLRPIRQELLDMYPLRQLKIRILFPKQVKRIEEYLVKDDFLIY